MSENISKDVPKSIEKEINEDISAQLDNAKTISSVLSILDYTDISKLSDKLRGNAVSAFEKAMKLPLDHKYYKENSIAGAKCIDELFILTPAKSSEHEQWFINLLNDTLKSLEPKDKKNGFAVFDSFDQQLRTLYSVINILPENIKPKILIKIEEINKKINENKNFIPEFLNKWIKESEEVDYIKQGINLEYAVKLNNQFQNQQNKSKDLSLPDLSYLSNSSVLSHLPDGSSIFKYKGLEWKFTASGDDFIVIHGIGKDGNERVLSFSAKNFIDHIEKNTLGELADMAESNYQSEQNGKSILEKFDLPKNQKTLHLSLLPQHLSGFGEDPVTGNLFPSLIMSQILKQKYGDAIDIVPPIITNTPLLELEKTVQGANQNGYKNIMLDIYSHGTKDNLAFDVPLTAKNIVDIVKKYPDCKFTINTSACLGGGLENGIMEIMNKDTTLQKQLTIFTQTKSDINNLPAVRNTNSKNGPAVGSSNYYIRLMKGLNDGKSYGESVRDADEDSKKFGTDASSIIDGTLISNRTKNNQESEV